ncbi:Ig-like domain-containing protein [Chondromyces apiculatus]|uniref:SbsA Ig-like domain-containing protein n=1 Tax=Chondromyces apiculatus DSM 436 TaxID=1192034 RepID=A0A017TIX9_9BACT|nr:Ig-like domain-containing protein [Chondromyces apiculatus]EYF08536.1 Hypothetical protein CAP_4066 [Chondromyces apiculatus DSM 436]
MKYAVLTTLCLLPAALFGCGSDVSGGATEGATEGSGAAGGTGGAGGVGGTGGTGGTGGAGGEEAPRCGPSDPPCVVASAPAANAADAPVDAEVAVTFSCAMAPDSVSAASFEVSGRSSGARTGELRAEGAEIAFTPTRPFFAGEHVDVALYPDLQSEAGVPLARPYLYQFVTATAESSGAPTASPQEFGTQLATVFGDFDGDGDLDLVMGANEEDDRKLYLWKNDGQGSFTRSEPGFNETDQALSLAAGDLDGDGDLDLFAGNDVIVGDGSKVWFNDGAGVFTDSGQSLINIDTYHTYDVVLGDVDGDGDLDALAATAGDFDGEFETVFWINDGNGTFSEPQPYGGWMTRQVAFADLDGDGDLDVLHTKSRTYTGDEIQWSHISFNDGTGSFPQGGEVGPGDVGLSLLGDLDGDGDLDAMFFPYFGSDFEVWRNDGAGNFTNSGVALPNATGDCAALGDMDGDGDLDAVVSFGGWNEKTKLLLNDGQGVFTKSPVQIPAGGKFVNLGDVDGDGDLDIFVANPEVPPSGVMAPRLWLNE